LHLVLAVHQVPLAAAQDSGGIILPVVEVTSDRSVYRLHEPVVLTVTVRNVSDRPQAYYALRPVGTLLLFEFLDPDGELVPMYAGPSEILGTAGHPDPTAPGAAKSGSMLISHFFPVTAKTGVYVLRIGINVSGVLSWDGASIGEIQIRVIEPGPPDLVTQLVQPYGDAVAAIRGNAVLDRTELEALERVISDASRELAYLREPALYYRALFDAELSRQDQWSVPEEKQVDMSARKPAEMAVREFEDFLREYPESVFAGNARGDLREAMSFLRRRSH
jgi:hypothetical protein